MASTSVKFLQDLLKKPGNDKCADCDADDPQWASHNLGIFLCEHCAGIHRSLGVHISKIKSVKLDDWDESQIRFMEAQGNLKSKEKFEQQLPICYRQPSKHDPQVLREQWIRAKYERCEFMDPDKQHYLSGFKEGYLWKRGKDDKKFLRRKFVLNEVENCIKYFTKEDAKEAKCVMRIDGLNATLVPNKVGNPNGMQLTFEQGDHTRNLFVYAESGEDLVSWYTAIRSAKLNRLRIAYPGANDQDLCQHLTRDFIREGWLSKTGPRPADAYRKRWCTLDKRLLMYYEDPLDPFPKGEIFVGTKDRGFAVREGVTPGIKDLGCCFTLKTPDRSYHFSAENDDDRATWMKVLEDVISMPLSPQDASSMSMRSPSK